MIRVDVIGMRDPREHVVSLDDGEGQVLDVAAYALRRHAEAHARRIRAALEWRPGSEERDEEEQEALEQRVAALVKDPLDKKPRRPWVERPREVLPAPVSEEFVDGLRAAGARESLCDALDREREEQKR